MCGTNAQTDGNLVIECEIVDSMNSTDLSKNRKDHCAGTDNDHAETRTGFAGFDESEREKERTLDNASVNNDRRIINIRQST